MIGHFTHHKDWARAKNDLSRSAPPLPASGYLNSSSLALAVKVQIRHTDDDIVPLV